MNNNELPLFFTISCSNSKTTTHKLFNRIQFQVPKVIVKFLVVKLSILNLHQRKCHKLLIPFLTLRPENFNESANFRTFRIFI